MCPVVGEGINIVMNDYYTYILYDGDTDEPFYVGKGSGDRWMEHLREAHKPISRQSNPMKCNKIREIERRSGSIGCIRIRMDNEHDSFEYERMLILLYGRQCDGSGILTNISDGGQGGSKARSVSAFNSKTGEFIGFFETVSAAASSLSIKCSDISSCLAGRQRTTKGYIFRGGKDDNSINPFNRNCPVDVYHIGISLIKVSSCDSIEAAASFMCVNPTLASNALNGKQKSVHGRFLVVAANTQPKPYTFYQYIASDVNGCVLFVFSSLLDATKSTGLDRSSILRSIRKQNARGGKYFWSKKQVIITSNV